MSELPKVKTSARDAKADVTYTVLSYRAITKEELMQAIAMYNSAAKRKPKKGSRIVIPSLIGFNER